MRTLFHILIFGSISLSILSCSEEKTPNSNSYFESVKDSLVVIKEIRDSLFAELYIENGIENYRQQNFCLPPSLVSLRFFFNIEVNDTNNIKVRRRNNNLPIDSLKYYIIDFYLTNSQENDIGNHFPMYSNYTKQEIQNYITDYNEKIKTSTDEEYLRIYRNKLSVVESFADVFSIIDSNSIRIISTSTQVQVWHSEKSTVENEVIDTVLFAYIDLKNQVAEHYFQESYAQIFDRNTRSPNSFDQKKLDAINFILPVNLHVMNWISDEEKFKSDFENENSQIMKRLYSFIQQP